MEFPKITIENRYPNWEMMNDYLSDPEEILLNDEYFTTVRRLSIMGTEIVVPNNFTSAIIEYDHHRKTYIDFPCEYHEYIDIDSILESINEHKDFELIIINLDPRVIDIDNVP